MEGAKLLSVKEIKQGDEIVNLGITDTASHYPESQKCAFTITRGKCISAAFYWFEDSTNLWVIQSKNNSQPPVHNSPPAESTTEKI